MRDAGRLAVRYESSWDPGTVRGQQYRAFGRHCAFRRLVAHPQISSRLVHDVLPEVVAYVAEAQAPANRAAAPARYEGIEADVRRVLAEVPGVKPWPWLVDSLFHFVVMLSLHVAPGDAGDILRRGSSVDEWIASDAIAALIDDGLGLEREDAKSPRHLTRPVELVPLNGHFLRPGRGVDLTHAMIDHWATAAHAAVEAAASAAPRPTRKRSGDIERWVGWWYRHDVLKEPFRTIVASEYGVDRISSLTGYVGRRAGLVRELLEETTTDASPSVAVTLR